MLQIFWSWGIVLAFSHSQWFCLCVHIIYSFMMLNHAPSMPNLFNIFIMNSCWIFSSVLFASIKIFKWYFLHFVVVKYFINWIHACESILPSLRWIPSKSHDFLTRFGFYLTEVFTMFIKFWNKGNAALIQWLLENFLPLYIMKYFETSSSLKVW